MLLFSSYKFIYGRCDVPTPVLIIIQVSWKFTLCGQVRSHRRLLGSAEHPRRLQTSLLIYILWFCSRPHNGIRTFHRGSYIGIVCYILIATSILVENCVISCSFVTGWRVVFDFSWWFFSACLSGAGEDSALVTVHVFWTAEAVVRWHVLEEAWPTPFLSIRWISKLKWYK